ncbi:hypothetical protein [Miltoncostaea oceani]|uniref:hypothetical protein n=1 Tax=Miltoncostaea oceani TaxID=2843216 RepID=UPI001FE51E08|nr:hypothetical protein [Miltoncostaea oceani]
MEREPDALEKRPSIFQGTRPDQRENPLENPPPPPVEPTEPGGRGAVDDHHEPAAGT